MRAPARVLVLLVCLLLPAGLLAQDQPPISVVQLSAYYSFGQQAAFSIEAEAEADVTALYLYLDVEGVERVDVIPVPIEPGPSVQASFQRDLRGDPFPPFGRVTWWWEVEDAVGHHLTTAHTLLQYVDNRFDWQTRSSGSLHIHSVVDDPVYLQAALDVARAGLSRIEQVLGGLGQGDIDVYLYPSEEELRAALELAGREWVGGQARPELGVVLVAVPRDEAYLARMERVIPHELSHLLVYRALGAGGYAHVPAWLDEGFATMNEVRPDPNQAVLLEQAWRRGQLIPLADLCAPFPADPDVALLSYAESASLVRYIQGRYGDAGIRALFAAYADEADCEGGIIRALDMTPERLSMAWRADMIGLGGWSIWLYEHAAWLLLWGLSIAVALPMAGLLRHKGRAGSGDGS